LALAGINVTDFVQGGIDAYEHCTNKDNNHYSNNLALCYAGIRNILYKNNYKVEALCSWTPKAKGIAEWWKQLFGESDGKDGTGIFPASANFTTDLHSLGQYFQQGERHLFSTHLKFKETNKVTIPKSDLKDGFNFLSNKDFSFVQEQAQQGTFLAHRDGKMPILIWNIPELNAYWLGNWMFTNMFACAVGGYARGIDPFNQPGVEDYKKNMFALMGKN
jgi:glucose-6-phosphate isomerase